VRRRQLVGLGLAVALVLGAVVLRERSQGSDGNDYGPLRRAVALQPCPTGLGPDLPRVTLPCLSGGPAVALAGARPGKPMLVNIWATWCPPCVREVPLLVRFDAEAGDRIGVVGVLHEDEQGQALEFARQYGMHYPSVVDDDGRVLRAYGSGPPVTLLVDADGKIRRVKRGEWHSLAELRSAVEDSLGLRL
jgi:thiol-disulfide isomerase/thioredoxin